MLYSFCMLSSQKWKDHRLMWNVSEFEGLDVVNLPVSKMWTPDAVLGTQKRHVITYSTEQLSSREFSAHAVDFCTNRFYARVMSVSYTHLTLPTIYSV